ncbi:hypothetical protein C0674_02710 [Sporolactobacillus terrae]|uniref:Uncharacterized protein n=2 Tax=Sporolactobacillus terrae TaxID=269673 RepID=A0ABX5Q4P4_9BACL|nr:hypothetical protein C0674_02710 [Sporolactobacillus terrae]QAA24589.1 hypothetical protein C0679_02690 [Sporolactobacillus terrae]
MWYTTVNQLKHRLLGMIDTSIILLNFRADNKSNNENPSISRTRFPTPIACHVTPNAGFSVYPVWITEHKKEGRKRIEMKACLNDDRRPFSSVRPTKKSMRAHSSNFQILKLLFEFIKCYDRKKVGEGAL